ncbi:MAG: D-glycero-alpha-D-manno-heptose-1,7-bisphosphate 7-phosphatase [Bacteroidota bacterium]|jgi:D-glycero-D-manno-heptose 1,7-bisphosphate phosphatase
MGSEMSVLYKKALFLDRDGVINHDPGDYTKSLAEFELLPGVIDTLKSWHSNGFLLIVITNQGGLDKQLYQPHDVHAMHQYLQGLCIANGFRITDFYFCPHHPDFSGKCLCRKPGSLMIEKALHQYDINPIQSLMIGDRERDVLAAQGAGVKGIQIPTNSAIPTYDNCKQLFLH